MDAETRTTIARKPTYRRFWFACLVAALTIVAYICIGLVVAYTGDAYIHSDLIRIAPEVSGPVQTVHVRDNEHVDAGALLVTLDPKPFALTVALKRDRVAGAEAMIAVKVQAEATQAAAIQSAQAALDLAQSEFQRITQLAGQGFAAQESLDRARESLRSAQDAVTSSKAQALVEQREVEQTQREAQVARADLDLAVYELTRTRLLAPTAGYVNNLDVRPGRYAKAGEPLVGLVDDNQWRIIANFKEGAAASARPGTRVWVWLDTHPWKIWPGTVQSVARAIARDEMPAQLLPYVAPTTDWIRLQRRLPMTILLDPPLPREALFMGADARVLFLR